MRKAKILVCIGVTARRVVGGKAGIRAVGRLDSPNASVKGFGVKPRRRLGDGTPRLGPDKGLRHLSWTLGKKLAGSPDWV